MSTATHEPAQAGSATNAWHDHIRAEIAEANPAADVTHAVVWLPLDLATYDAKLLDLCTSADAALVSAEDNTFTGDGEGEVRVVTLKELAGEGFATTASGTTTNPDPDTGELFKMPKVKIDMAQPTLVALAFSGGINVTDRDDPAWTHFYNDLDAGKSRQITVTVYTAGAKKRHRRDKDNNADAVVETKSLIVTDVHLEESD